MKTSKTSLRDHALILAVAIAITFALPPHHARAKTVPLATPALRATGSSTKPFRSGD